MTSPLRVRVQRDEVVRIYRSLKGTGVINVSVNQEVTPSDIIGISNYSAGFRVLNLANLLSVSPSDVGKYIKGGVGKRIYRGELLAEKTGFLGRKIIVTSPSDGILDYLNPKNGELKMTFLPKRKELPAGVFGIVEDINKEKGQIIIKTQATLVHGVFGSGRSRDGILNIIGKRDELLITSKISSEYKNQILVGGSLIFKEVISSAISNGIAGIVTGGINAKDYKGIAGGRLIFPKKLENDVGISIIVCEGFGAIPIGLDIYEVLAKYNGKYISIDGNKAIMYLPSFESKSMLKVKSTSLKPLDDLESINFSENKLTELKVGLKVRVIGNSYLGEQGKVIYLDKSETILPSGVKSVMATLETKTRKIQVPVANLEVIL